MKKVAFMVVLVAIIVGVVFGGLSMASASLPAIHPPPPTCTPVHTPIPMPPCCVTMLESIKALDEKVTSIQGDISGIDLANVTRMESDFGFTDNVVIGGYTNAQIINRDNPQVRHVHLSYYFARSPEGSIGVMGEAYPHPVDDNYSVQHNDIGSYTEEFDAKSWDMWVLNHSDDEITYYIVYAWTETYAP